MLYIGLNAILVSALFLTIADFSDNIYFSEERSSEDLEDLEKELDIRYKPEGPLYNDLEPNVSKYTDEGADQKKIPVYKVETNSYGARDDPFKIEGDKENIVVLGDSFTFGWGVNKSDRYTEVAERNLKNSSKTDFMNLGISGTGITDYYLTLKHKGLQLKPDKVIVGLRYQSVRSEKNAIEFREEARNKIPMDAENREEKIQDYQREKVEDLLQRDIDKTEVPKYVEKMAKLASENDIELIFYLIEDTIDNRKVEAYKEMAQKHNFTLLMPPEELTSSERDKLIIRKGDSHYNQKAHRILGTYLAEELDRMN